MKKKRKKRERTFNEAFIEQYVLTSLQKNWASLVGQLLFSEYGGGFFLLFHNFEERSIKPMPLFLCCLINK